ncbi:hypothetical protein PHLGIDRAFT_127633 [Phlebiopsis gigantea 11061_1 CR5-6]|uniref:BTB domain-containing protein n=1 Tax=Phlebiopsis gigantea (strain 11061_1 CR5-6) TaxID=745531 RepID=A0A0C3SAX5_PHLG1|nr:hypothetical protein PHLGIDRAFT_127633 [Phlebiopsis gigantea 11061_1 CR5-6]
MSYFTTTPNIRGGRPSTKHYTHAAEPFNTAHADIVLRSSDLVEFRVNSSILTLTSSPWEAKIQSMQGSTQCQRDQKGRLIMNVSEDSNTLDLLLRIVYPTHTPPIETVWDAFSVLEAARKYEMIHATKTAKKAIAGFAESMPLRVYAVAAKREWDQEMRAAALASLHHAIPEVYVQELEDLRAGVYYRLLAYHRVCGKAAVALVTDLSWMGEIALKTDWQPCWATCANTACRRVNSQPSTWFQQYVGAVTQAIRAQPRSKTLDDPALMDVALVRAITCDDCRPYALADLRKFNELLGKEIEGKIEDIQLEIK